MGFYVIDGLRAGKSLTILFTPSLKFYVCCGFYRLLRVFYQPGVAPASQIALPTVLEELLGLELALSGTTSWRDSSFLQQCHALLFNRRRLAAMGPTIRRRRIVPPRVGRLGWK